MIDASPYVFRVVIVAAVVIVGAVAIVLLAAAGSMSVHAANITVDTTDDELNADGDCSLREAIEAANTDAVVDACTAGSGADIITVPAGTYVITLAGADNTNAAGDFDILDDLTINGAGADTTIIDGGGIDRVFDIPNDADTVVIASVTIQNGDAAGSGGGISSNGTLTVNVSTIRDNTSPSDGGGIDSSGPLTVLDSTISGNSANLAGGIYFCAASDEPATISGTTISGNNDDGAGGGIWHECGDTMTITDSTITGNTTTGDGGGILNEEDLVIDNTTISGNTADGTGGGISSFGDVTITNSTLSGNTATDGGGMKNDGAVLMTNVTISGNTASGNGGGLGNNSQLLATMLNVTITNNSATGTGDAIHNDLGIIAVKNTIVAGNGADNCGGPALSSGGNNLEDTNDCGLAAAGDQTNTDPMLGALTDNGGPTLTHALLAGSPAIDTASADCPTPATATDQRGVTRPVDGDQNGTAECDIGAFEFEPVQATPTPTPTPTAAPTATPAELPETGGQSRSDGNLPWLALLAALGAATVTGIAFAAARKR